METMPQPPHPRIQLNPDPSTHAAQPLRPDFTRRKFLGTLTGVLAAGIAIHVIGCSETDFAAGPESGAPAGGPQNGTQDPQPSANPGTNGTTGTTRTLATADRTGSISSNHGHAALIAASVQDAGEAFTLHIEGSAGHDHAVALTAQEVANLKAGLPLTKTSSNVNGHTHTVSFSMITSATPSRTGDVGNNHGHAAVVTGVVLDAETAYTLHIEGSAGHNHTVALTAQEVAGLKAGAQLTKTSSNANGHEHSVTFASVTAIWRPK